MLKGERVTMRALRADDTDTMYVWRVDLMTWGATTDEPPYPMTLERYRELSQKAASAPGSVDFAIEVDGVLAGRSGLFAFDDLAHNAEVSLTMAPEARGKGFGTEALHLLCAFGFDHRNLHRVWLETLASNGAALRCYAKAGFVEEGRLRDHAWVDGAYEDIVRMALLRAEWRG